MSVLFDFLISEDPRLTAQRPQEEQRQAGGHTAYQQDYCDVNVLEFFPFVCLTCVCLV
jgi:hypothetical protein